MEKTGNNSIQNILNAAEAIIIEKGVKDTSLADIAKQAGISKGTLYYYYSSKNDLVYDIAERHLNQLNEQLQKWIDDIKDKTVPEDIMSMAFQKVANDYTRSKLHVYLLQEVVTDNVELREKYIAKYNNWRIIIKTGLMKIFHNEEKDNSMLADIMLAAMDGFTIQALLGFKDVDFNGISNFLVRGMRK